VVIQALLIASSPPGANSRTRPSCRHSAWVLALLTILAWIGIRGEATAAAADAMNPARADAFPRAFRLGTAAAPFGWSTAIGDLDSDGRPDFAIADRPDHRPRGYAYTIEILLSRAQSQTLALQSVYDALTVRLRDVDDDRDLDLVATPALTQEVVRIWLNDGNGRFHEADSHAFPPVLPPLRGVISPTDTVTSAGAWAPERPGDVRLVAGARLHRPASASALTGSPVQKPRFVFPSSFAPRAPPSPRI
jgi:hypothetical protein